MNRQPQSIDHYENFPVASWLCPRPLRAPIAALYHFARTADDLADEGDAPPQQRLDDLAAFRAELLGVFADQTPSPRWSRVFGPLQAGIRQHALPQWLLCDLLDAFRQDVVMTRDGQRYVDRAELLDYCRRSANPIGRLLLHLYGIDDANAQLESDAICSALQLINFWQDLSQDIPRSRNYLPVADCNQFGVSLDELSALHPTPSTANLVAAEIQWAQTLMREGAPLVHRIPGRAGWELRLVVQGGLRILEKIVQLNYDTLRSRPTLTKWDAPLLLWRAFWM